ncbi:MAG: alpha/beta hydrolase-fold protein [Bryobacteraceae bacterium]
MFRAPSRLFTAATVAVVSALAQAQRSPIINPDGSATFTLTAPNADKVYVGGEFDDKVNRPPGALMTKDAKGVWSYTTAPLVPGVYYYGFSVDGLFTIDPNNTRYRPFIRQTPLNNTMEIRGEAPFVWDIAPDTPRGEVHFEEFRSATLGRFANAYVYTPPSYAAEYSRTYPVLYLLHGASTGELGDTSREWVMAGYANRIMDNLIAAGKAKEMIVVMVDSQTPGASPNLTLLASYELFEKYLLTEVIPLVQSRYRTATGKENRYLAGLSRGGTQTFHVGFRNPSLFSALGAFSISVPTTYPDAYPGADAAALNEAFRLIYYSCGTEDSDQRPGYDRSTAMLVQRGIRFDAANYPGGHIWHVWRNSLAEFVSKLK